MATAVAGGGQPGAKVAPVPWVIAPVVALAAFMEVLDIAIANVALQHIAGNLGASGDEATWVLTSYLVTNAIVLPVSGWLATVVGRKRFFMMCIAGFSVASLLCGMAPTLTVLILCRALQGLTGGGLQPLAQAILADAFPPAQRGIAFGFYGMAVVAAPAIGPTLGGWITDNLDWRWVFLINVPVGAVLLLLAQRMVHDPPALVAERARRLREGVRIDYIGFALLTLGLGMLQVVLDRGQQDDWFGSSFITACALVSLVAVLYFVAWELASDDPIVDLRLLANRNFATANLLMFMLGFILLGSTALLPQLVQTLMGYTATQAGMVLSPGGFAIIFLMPVVGRMVTKVDPRLMIAGGLVVCSAALWRMSGFTLGVDYRTVAEARIVQAVGLAFLFIPISTTAYVGLPPGKSNNASALINLSRNLGGSVGISLLTSQMARREQFHQVRLADHMGAYDPEVVARLGALQHRFAAAGFSTGEALDRARATLAHMLDAQVRMLAYVDAFWLLAVAFAAMLPVVLLMRRPPRGQGGAAGAH